MLGQLSGREIGKQWSVQHPLQNKNEIPLPSQIDQTGAATKQCRVLNRTVLLPVLHISIGQNQNEGFVSQKSIANFLITATRGSSKRIVCLLLFQNAATISII